ncbi:MAG: hypothetical protein H6708_19600 [Kofleriaceae bacterium]|nr:hypothetical protein [Kofleriaceae bacterium]
MALGLVTMAGLAACGDDTSAGDDTTSPDADTTMPDAPPGSQTIRVNDDITEDTTWVTGNTYVIPRLKQLFVEPGATLTIEPGVVVKGEQGSVLVITRGAKIMAEGTADAPIVMTSAQANTPGYWGGLLVLGAAPINTNVNSNPSSTEATFEAFTSAIPEGLFGGTNAADNSGKIKYVRIEFAGFNFVADREFNNFTLCGVGSGTEIDYVQVHGGSDDGIEFFGGTVNVKHLVSSQNGDDGFDTDNGWEGKAQFVIIQNVHPQGSGDASNGYESDNHGTAASYTAAPRTLPTIYNVTMLGDHSYTGGTSFATVLRRGTGGHYYNHIIAGFPQGLEVRDAATKDQLDAGNLFIKNSIIYNNAADGNNWPPPQASNDIDESEYFTSTDWNNQFVDPGLPAAAFDPSAPDFKPTAGAAALTGGATPPNDGFFDTSATYIGAVGTEDWTAGWTSFPQPD